MTLSPAGRGGAERVPSIHVDMKKTVNGTHTPRLGGQETTATGWQQQSLHICSPQHLTMSLGQNMWMVSNSQNQLPSPPPTRIHLPIVQFHPVLGDWAKTLATRRERSTAPSVPSVALWTGPGQKLQPRKMKDSTAGERRGGGTSEGEKLSWQHYGTVLCSTPPAAHHHLAHGPHVAEQNLVDEESATACAMRVCRTHHELRGSRRLPSLCLSVPRDELCTVY